MSRVTYLSVFFLFTTIVSFSRAQERAPHGLANENPEAFSPSAVEFFGPNSQQPETREKPWEASRCSPFPMAAEVEKAADQENESKISSPSHESRTVFGAAGTAGIVISLTFFVFLAMGAYYALNRRHANMNKANSIQPAV